MGDARPDHSARSERTTKRESPDVPSLEVLLQNVIAERNALRQQNDQLWKIIEKQRTIIAQLQTQSQPQNGVPASTGGADSGPISPMLGRPEGGHVQAAAVSRPTSGVSAASRRPRSRDISIDRAERGPSQNVSPTNSGEWQNPTSPRTRSASDPHTNGLTLPQITINGSRGNGPRNPGSAHAHDRRERSTSGSSQRPPTILPHVQGASPAAAALHKSGSGLGSNGRNSGVPSATSSQNGHARRNSGGNSLGPSEESTSFAAPRSLSSPAEPGATALDQAADDDKVRTNSTPSVGSKPRKSAASPVPIPASAPVPGPQSAGSPVDPATAPSKRSSEARKKIRSISDRSRLTHVNESDGHSPERQITESPRASELLEYNPPIGQGSDPTDEPPKPAEDAAEFYVAERTASLDRPQKKQHRPSVSDDKPEIILETPIVQEPPQGSELVEAPTAASAVRPAIPSTPSSGLLDVQHPSSLTVTSATTASSLSLSMTGASPSTDNLERRQVTDSPFKSLFKNADQVSVAVTGSQIRLNDKAREVISFTITVKDAANADLWKIEKVYSDFLALDTKLKTNQPKALTSKIGRLPEKALFTTHSPTKSDQRKVQLELYLQNVKEICRDSQDLINFLSSGVIEGTKAVSQAPVDPASVTSVKEGYLFKKGKNFGAWKPRYFVLKVGGVLEYYESQRDRTNLLGCIKLKYVFVSRQSSSSPFDPSLLANPTPGQPGSPQQSATDTDYRHAFMLTEYKKSCFSPENKERGGEQFVDTKVVSRHILCAENDEERDEWVQSVAKEIKTVRPDAIKGGRLEDNVPRSQPIDVEAQPPRPDGSAPRGIEGRPSGLDESSSPEQRPRDMAFSQPSDRETPEEWRDDAPVAPTRITSIALAPGSSPSLSRDALGPTVLAMTPPSPVNGGTPRSRGRTHVDDMERVMMQPEPPPLIPLTDGTPTSQTSTGATPAPSAKAVDKKSRRMTTFNWGKKSKDSLANSNSRSQTLADSSRRVFGVALEQGVAISKVREDLALPAVMYRCIEYLDAKRANEEEGIYRLSGSSTVIQGLKAAFDNEGDYDILASQQYYDVHAVAGLLKLYLRELPTPVLTKELQRSFLHVMDLVDRDERIEELARLVGLLPVANYTLLKTLMAHLVRVVRRCDVNKMNVRNVGIVFSPTVGVPAGVFTLMMAEYSSVFWWDGKEETRNSEANPEANPAEADWRSDDAPMSSGTEGPREDLPVPKRRQPNSAKRRQRQHAMIAGLALVNNAEDGESVPSPGGSSISVGDHHQQHHQQQQPNDHVLASTSMHISDARPTPISPARSLPRPISASSRRSRHVSVHSPSSSEQHQHQSQNYQHSLPPPDHIEPMRPQTPLSASLLSADADRKSIGQKSFSSEVFVAGEEEVDGSDDHGEMMDADDESESDGDRQEEAPSSPTDPAAVRDFEAYFTDQADELRFG
ncbi:hypothetical protein HKX48_006727 [Thoreauomyces humboldtii]|nr:hypothetical protein HKX48_006727 [Thoreauomyces humboldtii]